MASETMYSPRCEVRWCNLLHPRPQLDPAKPMAYSCDLILNPQVRPDHAAFLELLEKTLAEALGTKKTRSPKGTPWKPDKTNPSLIVVRFKTQQSQKRNGTFWPGPVVIDAKRQPWCGDEIGNGSEVKLSFGYYDWAQPEGVGITLTPKAAQVLHFVPYEREDATEGFEEEEGFSQAAAAGGFEDEFGDSEEVPF